MITFGPKGILKVKGYAPFQKRNLCKTDFYKRELGIPPGASNRVKRGYW